MGIMHDRANLILTLLAAVASLAWGQETLAAASCGADCKATALLQVKNHRTEIVIEEEDSDWPKQAKLAKKTNPEKEEKGEQISERQGDKQLEKKGAQNTTQKGDTQLEKTEKVHIEASEEKSSPGSSKEKVQTKDLETGNKSQVAKGNKSHVGTGNKSQDLVVKVLPHKQMPKAIAREEENEELPFANQEAKEYQTLVKKADPEEKVEGQVEEQENHEEDEEPEFDNEVLAAAVEKAKKMAENMQAASPEKESNNQEEDAATEAASEEGTTVAETAIPLAPPPAEHQETGEVHMEGDNEANNAESIEHAEGEEMLSQEAMQAKESQEKKDKELAAIREELDIERHRQQQLSEAAAANNAESIVHAEGEEMLSQEAMQAKEVQETKDKELAAIREELEIERERQQQLSKAAEAITSELFILANKTAKKKETPAVNDEEKANKLKDKVQLEEDHPEEQHEEDLFSPNRTQKAVLIPSGDEPMGLSMSKKVSEEVAEVAKKLRKGRTVPVQEKAQLQQSILQNPMESKEKPGVHMNQVTPTAKQVAPEIGTRTHLLTNENIRYPFAPSQHTQSSSSNSYQLTTLSETRTEMARRAFNVGAAGSKTWRQPLDDESDPDIVSGATATLDEAGYAVIATICCPLEMSMFATRVVSHLGFVVCNDGALEGVMSWYYCANQTRTFEELVADTIAAADGDCAWVGTESNCPTRKDNCPNFPDASGDSHRRRNCLYRKAAAPEDTPEAATELTESVEANATTLPVTESVDFELGRRIVLDAGEPNEEVNEVASLGALLQTKTPGVVLKYPLKFHHDADCKITMPKATDAEKAAEETQLMKAAEDRAAKEAEEAAKVAEEALQKAEQEHTEDLLKQAEDARLELEKQQDDAAAELENLKEAHAEELEAAKAVEAAAAKKIADELEARMKLEQEKSAALSEAHAVAEEALKVSGDRVTVLEARLAAAEGREAGDETTTTAAPDDEEITTTTPHADVDLNCYADQAVDLNFEASSLPQNNLGGNGPSEEGDEEMLFKNIASFEGSSVDMIVTATTSYTPADSNENGLQGKYAQINVLSGTSVDLNFRFQKSDSFDAVKLPEFYFTIMDIDQSTMGHRERFYISGWEHVLKEDFNDFETVQLPDGRTLFKSQQTGYAWDDPSDPAALGVIEDPDASGKTVDQSRRSAMLVFRDLSQFVVTLEATQREGTTAMGRNFRFAGSSSLISLCDGVK